MIAPSLGKPQHTGSAADLSDPAAADDDDIHSAAAASLAAASAAALEFEAVPVLPLPALHCSHFLPYSVLPAA